MVIKQVELQHVCGITSKLPDTGQVEVAFAGKSNVGKSSLINALMNRKSLARTSAQPGKTQTINYYHINEEMYLVDLPGYGFARASEEVKAKWGKLIEDYLHQSKMLHAVFLLIDIRHAPSNNDRFCYFRLLPFLLVTEVFIPKACSTYHTHDIIPRFLLHPSGFHQSDSRSPRVPVLSLQKTESQSYLSQPPASRGSA